MIDKTAGETFRALQAKARAEHGGNTQPLLVVYAMESFLRRLAMSDHAQRRLGMLASATAIGIMGCRRWEATARM